MGFFSDDANRFATRAPDRVEQLRNAGVRQAMEILHRDTMPADHRLEAAWTTMILSVDHQALISGLSLPIAWWTLKPDTVQNVAS